MENKQNNLNSQQKKKKTQRSLNTAARYSSLAFEMLILILAGVYGGLKLDEKLNSEPAFVIIGSLFGVGLSLYFVFKDLTKKN